jgi:tetratricopeptide (TPR) repeat protein
MLCFALSLMSKPMLVTLPFLLLLLDFWPFGRMMPRNKPRIAPLAPHTSTPGKISIAGLFVEKLPLLALSAASSVITLIAQSRGGAVATLDSVPLSERLVTAAVAYGIYIRQMFWPANLAPLYPLPDSWSHSAVVVSVLMLLILTALAILAARRRPAMTTGWLWYLGTLVPVIGLIQVGSQAHADRYTYVPLIGLFIMAAWAVPTFASNQRLALIIRNSAVMVLILLCAATTWLQLGHWRNSIALSQRAIDVNPENAVAHFNLASAFAEQDQVPQAINHLEIAANINPNWADVQFNLGNNYARLRDSQSAIKAFNKALEIQPAFTAALNNLGIELTRIGEREAAVNAYKRAVSIDPTFAAALSNLGDVLASLGRLDESANRLAEALRLQPDDDLSHIRLGATLARLNRLPQAREHFAKAVALDPQNPAARMYLATALRDEHRADQAAEQFAVAAQLARAQGNQELLQEIMRRAEQVQPTGPDPAVEN